MGDLETRTWERRIPGGAPRRIKAPTWHREAIIYALDVATFMDSDGDGVGDFKGLVSRLDYLRELGVTCLWLLPFYPTADRDDGYDVVDHKAVDPRVGTLDEFATFVDAARRHGIRVLIDLVINHTSEQHPWFQAARKDPDSPFRNYYSWSRERPEQLADSIVFPGVQHANWTYDETADAYYFHRFYDFEPDLNTANPAVRRAILDIIDFWLEFGISGFRVDASPFLIQELSDAAPFDAAGHMFLRELRQFVAERQPDAVLMAEADHDPEVVRRFFGHGDEMSLILNFLLNDELFLALAQERAGPIRRGLELMPAVPDGSGFANFLRSHDELNLGGLRDIERGEVLSQLSPDPASHIYGRGTRHRLAPLFDGNVDRILLAYSLLLSLPGTPVLYYGEEIGMGDDLSLPERLSVRTPMQWSAERNAGFSRAEADALCRPIIDGGPFRYQRVNVEAQSGNDSSLLCRVQALIAARAACPEIRRGSWRLVNADHPAVHAILFQLGPRRLLAVHNLSGGDCRARLDVEPDVLAQGEQVAGSRDPDNAARGSGVVVLEPYGFRWIRSGGS